MPISHDKKLIFVHIPKNAGESVEKALGMYRGDPKQTMWGVVGKRTVLQHLTGVELRDRIGDEAIWNGYFKFAIVRNPWSKAVSE